MTDADDKVTELYLDQALQSIKPARGKNRERLLEVYGDALKRRADSALALHQTVSDVYGVKRATVIEAGPMAVAIVVEGGDPLVLAEVVQLSTPAGVSINLVVWSAPWWWRAWCWVRHVARGGRDG